MNAADIQIWPALAGLGLFLFGMFMLEESVKKLSGRSFKLFLRKQTGTAVQGVLAGALITALLQSSSMVILLVMSFTGAGIFGLRRGISILLGVNLGTTVTGWLVTLIGFKLNIEAVILPFIAIGGLGIIFTKSERLSSFSKLLMGFSLMFLGLAYMKEGFSGFTDALDVSVFQDRGVFVYLLVGFLLAATIQSSSAAAMIFLTSLSAGMIVIEDAVYLMIGADLGTTVTAIIGTIGGNTIKKKIGWSHFAFNAYNTLLSLSLAGVYLWIIKEGMRIGDPLIALVTFHSLSKFTGIVTVLPFLKFFTRFIDKVIPVREKRHASFITLSGTADSMAALEALGNETVPFLNRVLTVNSAYFDIGRGSANPAVQYAKVKDYENEIATFYMQLQRAVLSGEEAEKLTLIIEAVRSASASAKEIKNIKHNLDELKSAVKNEFFEFYEQLQQSQREYYKEITEVIEHHKVLSVDDLETLENMHKSKFRNETSAVYNIYAKNAKPEVPMPSTLNVLREINNSNELLLRSIRLLISLYPERALPPAETGE